MRVPQGYGIIYDPDAPGGVAQEADSFTCAHCQFVVFVRPFAAPTDSNGLCQRCWKPICNACVRRGTCTPWEAQLARMEARDRLLRAVEQAR